MPQRRYDVEQIYETLVTAFDDASFACLVRSRLDESLLGLSSGSGDFREFVLNVVLWADSQNRLDTLIQGALQQFPANALLINLAEAQGPARAGAERTPLFARRTVAAFDREDPLALAHRLAEWRRFHHCVQELLFAISDTDALMANLAAPTRAMQARRALAAQLDEVWLTDTAPKVSALKTQVSKLTMIGHETVVRDVTEIVMRTGSDSLNWRLNGFPVASANPGGRASILIWELQGVLIDALRVAGEWNYYLVGMLSDRLGTGGRS